MRNPITTLTIAVTSHSCLVNVSLIFSFETKPLLPWSKTDEELRGSSFRASASYNSLELGVFVHERWAHIPCASILSKTRATNGDQRQVMHCEPHTG